MQSEAIHLISNTHHSAASAISLCGNASVINNDLSLDMTA